MLLLLSFFTSSNKKEAIKKRESTVRKLTVYDSILRIIIGYHIKVCNSSKLTLNKAVKSNYGFKKRQLCQVGYLPTGKMRVI